MKANLRIAIAKGVPEFERKLAAYTDALKIIVAEKKTAGLRGYS